MGLQVNYITQQVQRVLQVVQEHLAQVVVQGQVDRQVAQEQVVLMVVVLLGWGLGL